MASSKREGDDDLSVKCTLDMGQWVAEKLLPYYK